MNASYLKSIFYYDGTNLINRITRNSRALVGLIVGNDNGHGYLTTMINGKRVMVHRIIWVMETGLEIPLSLEIDHIDGNRKNNQMSNLRMVTHSQNQRNQKLQCRNTSGKIGVRFYPITKRWIADIRIDGKTINLGYYKNKADAIRVRELAELEHNFHPNHGKVIL